MAGLHAIDPDDVPGLTHSDVLADMWAVYDLVGGGSPVFEKTQAWLEANRPATTSPTIVHGDLRLGNLIVDRRGLAAVIDWELAHLGDPLEDLAWICVKAWRFGGTAEVAGIGSIDELVTAYEEAGGEAVDRAALHWWLVQKTLQWGLICMGQAFAHLSGAVRSHELAAVGRRVAEQEWDLVELIAPDAWADTLADPPDLALPDEPGAYGRPTARELLGAVRDFLTEDVMPATSGHLAYQSRVAANVLSVVERELAQASPDPPGDDWPSLARSAWAGWPSPTRSACPEVMRTRQRSIRIERPRRLLLTGRQINGVRYARRRDEPRQDPRPRRPTEPGLGDAAVGRPVRRPDRLGADHPGRTARRPRGGLQPVVRGRPLHQRCDGVPVGVRRPALGGHTRTAAPPLPGRRRRSPSRSPPAATCRCTG